jgi:hypothetical protein
MGLLDHENISPLFQPGETFSESKLRKAIYDIISSGPEIVTLSAKNVVLNLNEDYFEHIVQRMDKKQIELLIHHINRLKLLAEKVLIDLA